MLVLVGGVVVVGGLVGVVVGAGATGSVVVSLLGKEVLVGGVVVTADGGVDDVDGDVELPPRVSSTIPYITSAIRMAASAPKTMRAAGLRYHGVDPVSGCRCP
jgi:hypothetical protein